jgi:hypothetical protein
MQGLGLLLAMVEQINQLVGAWLLSSNYLAAQFSFTHINTLSTNVPCRPPNYVPSDHPGAKS